MNDKIEIEILDSRFHGNDKRNRNDEKDKNDERYKNDKRENWIPVFTGMTKDIGMTEEIEMI